MARGVMAIAETQAEAEHQIRAEAPQMRVLRSREIDLTGLPPLASGPVPKHWVVVVEHQDPDEEAKLVQHDDPETHCEREARLLYLKLGIDPMLLVSGNATERFPCPACGEMIELKVAMAREAGTKPQNRQCPKCKTPMTRSAVRSWEIISRERKPQQPCIFCGVVDDSREHVIPAWIAKQLGIKDFLPADTAFVSPNQKRRKQDVSFASYRSPCFCGSCNRHFKSLEDAVIPLLVPMARGMTLSLDQASQQLLALWADKTAMALIGADETLRGNVLPPEHTTAVREGRLADQTWVAFFPWTGGPVLGTGFGQVARTKPPPVVMLRAYMAFLTFAQIGFCVMGIIDPLDQDERIDRELTSTYQFWPLRRPLLHWPPGPPVDNRILPVLMSSAPIRRV
jgi:hypothetical protein